MSLIEKALEKTRAEGAKPAALAMPVSAVAATTALATPTRPRTARPVPARRLTIDMERLRSRGMIPSADAQRRHAQQIRSIKNYLLLAARVADTERDRVIMITSALSGDGKTFNAVSIALSLAAEKDFHVVLVDGDVPKPNLGELFGIEDAAGILDAAREPALDPEQLVIGTNLLGLDLLPAGRGGADSAEILSSGRMREVIGQLSSVQNRIVLLDSPPLLQTSEAAVLAQHAGQVLLVVREALTPERAVLDALAMLGDRKGVALVLNGASESRLEEYYYGYGQYSAYGEEQGAAGA